MYINKLNEIWRDIKGYEGLYQVSNFGRVKSIDRYVNGRFSKYLVKGNLLKLHFDKRGYLFACISKNNKQKNCYVHRLVAEAFLPNPDNLPQVNHKDEIKINNTVWINEDETVDYEKSNLEWCTNQYNANYGTRNERIGKHNIGNTRAKKRPVLQYDLEGNFIKKYFSISEVERQFGFKVTNICSCCKGIYKQAYGYIWKYEGDAV